MNKTTIACSMLVCLLAGANATAVQAATLTIAWDRNPEPDVTSYVVRYGVQFGQYPNGVPCGNQTQCTFSVSNNKTYYFVVLAINSAGLQSPPSEPVLGRIRNGSVLVSVAPARVNFTAEGGTAALAVTSTRPWAATSDASWLRVVPGSASSSNGVVSYSVTPNTFPAARSAVLAFAGVNIPVDQPAGPPLAWRIPSDTLPGDYDGDGRADLAVYRDTTGEWLTSSSAGAQVTSWGSPGSDDIPAPADYDGDGRADIAVFRNTTGEWFVQRSAGGSTTLAWGSPALRDLPIPADYDGDGQADIGVYRGSTGEWLIRRSTGGLTQVPWGSAAHGDVPVPRDYDGDGIADIAIYRRTSGEWVIRRSTAGLMQISWGAPALGDVPVPGDYDGDRRADVAVYRTTTGEWIIRNSTNNSLRTVAWGSYGSADIPVPADYDGDGRVDIAVYRGSTGQWLRRYSAGGTDAVSWGNPSLTDIVRGR